MKIHTGNFFFFLQKIIKIFFQSFNGKNKNIWIKIQKALKKMGVVENYEDIRNLSVLIIGGIEKKKN